MSEENVKTVRDATEAFKRGDLNTWFEYIADDIDHRAVEGAPDDPGPIHGKDALRAYVQDWRDTFDDFTSEPVELIDGGEDNVVAVTRISGRAKLSGVETDLTFAALYTLREGKIVRGREYWTRDEAMGSNPISRLPRLIRPVTGKPGGAFSIEGAVASLTACERRSGPFFLSQWPSPAAAVDPARRRLKPRRNTPKPPTGRTTSR